MLNTICKPFAWWIAKIIAEEPYTFVRYGDGELNGAFWCGRRLGGGRTKNGDHHTLRNKELRRLLHKSITQPGNAQNYYRSLWMDGDCQPRERLARDYLEAITPPGVIWYNALAIQDKLNAGKGFPYFRAMRNLKMPIVIVGPKHLRAINQVGCFNYTGFVEVPYRRAFFARERIVDEALWFRGPVFYSIHAGPASPVIAWTLWKEKGDEAIIFDIGSILDGYVSVKFGGPVEGNTPITRKFWKKKATHKILQRNLRGGR